MDRPRLLDLFCGAGGASVGYHRAGFDVVGVDIKPQPNYPFEFVEADAMHLLEDGYFWNEEYDCPAFDAIHASPPCQAYTSTSNRWRGNGGQADNHADLIGHTRELLRASGLPYVIENVVGAAGTMRTTLLLAGGMFGLGVHRPRLFESNVLLLAGGPGTKGDGQIGVYGKRPDGRRLNSRTTQRAARSLEEGAAAMGIDWMTWDELREAIPPAYTELIGAQLLAHVKGGGRMTCGPKEARMADRLCSTCMHTESCHGPDGCEVEVSDYGVLDCACERFVPLASGPEEGEDG